MTSPAIPKGTKMQNEITDKMVEAFGYKFWPVNATSKIMGQREEIRSALSAALAAAEAQPVAWQTQRYERGMWVETNLHLTEPTATDDLVVIPLYDRASPPVARTAEGWEDGTIDPETGIGSWIPQDIVEEAEWIVERLCLSDANNLKEIKSVLRVHLHGRQSRPPSVDTEARRMALEEAAKIAETTGIDNTNEWPGETWIAQRIAAAIRALIPQEGEYTAHDGEKR